MTFIREVSNCLYDQTCIKEEHTSRAISDTLLEYCGSLTDFIIYMVVPNGCQPPQRGILNSNTKLVGVTTSSRIVQFSLGSGQRNFTTQLWSSVYTH